METVQSIRQPVIAQVQGVATAAGCQLVATCDLAIAAEEAWFATPGVKIGLFCSTPMVALTRAIGRKRAMEMLLTARPVPAREAAEWGLINRAVPAAALAESVRELALAVAAGSDYTVSLGKRAFYEQIEMPQEAAYQFARSVMERNAKADVAQVEMRAFLEKRGVR
jgi:enoyl-CoA hydratase/carnithine racemase